MEFIIDAIVTGESGHHTLIGRCGDAPIRVGDEFHSVYRYDDATAGNSASRVDERAVVVIVNQIQAYGKRLDVLGQGMTGSCVVSGTNLEKLAAGMVLGGQPALAQPALGENARNDH